MRYHLKLVGIGIIRKFINNKYRREYGEKGTILSVGM